MRQIVLDTETTGLSPTQGHRIIEIGCVELVNRKLTGNVYQQYINPEREIDKGAMHVHGITNEFVADKPLFADIVEEFKEFVAGAELIIHNAPFDLGFLDHELKLNKNKWKKIEKHCTVFDTLSLARKLHPGQKNNLDALCKRYKINNAHREYHGALLDSEILADLYLEMTGGQIALDLSVEPTKATSSNTTTIASDSIIELPVIKATEEEIQAHEKIMENL